MWERGGGVGGGGGGGGCHTVTHAGCSVTFGMGAFYWRSLGGCYKWSGSW